MTDTTPERPFYEVARERKPVPDASRAPVIVACVITFLLGAWAVVAGTPSAPATAEGGGFLVGYAFTILVMAVVFLGAVATALLSLSSGRRVRQRSAAQDLAWTAGAAAVGGVLGLMLALALAGSAQAVDQAARQILDQHRRDMTADSQAFKAGIDALNGPSGLLNLEDLATDPGYRRATDKLASVRALIADHRPRFSRRKAEARAKLAAAGARRQNLAEFDEGAARGMEMADRYWEMQIKVVERAEAVLAVLKRSPGVWRNGQFVFDRRSDLFAFQGAALAYESTVREAEVMIRTALEEQERVERLRGQANQ
jgi:hypothetical protein